MSQLDRHKVPEHLEKMHEQKMIFICYSRLRIIIPLLILFCSYFILRSFVINRFTEEQPFQILFDISSLAAVIILLVFYILTKPGSVKAVHAIHSVYQKATALLIILWGAGVTHIVPDYALGYTTMFLCLFIASGLMLIEMKYLVLFSFIGILSLHIGMSIKAGSFISSLPVKEMSIIGAGFVISLIINTLNRNALTEQFMLEIELEKKVADRTRKLEEETEKARLSDNMKTVFLANMSHEIRTPLNGILGFSNLLRDEKLKPETRQKYIEIVIKSGNTLLDILNEIIEVSRIESGAVDLFLEEFCLNEVIEDIIDGFRVHDKVQSGSISLMNETRGFEPVIIVSDRLKIIQIMLNLINNAVKYTDSGYISIGFELKAPLVSIFVKDTGKGIEQEEQEAIFERFRQVEKNPYSGKDGVGLGLTIVKGYIELLKGELFLDSELEKGSEFRIEIPVNFHEE